MRNGLSYGLDGYRLWSRGQVTREVGGWLVQVGGSRTGKGLGSAEENVHDLGSGGDYRSQFPAVHDLGGPGGGMPDEPGDLLDADPAVAQQAKAYFFPGSRWLAEHNVSMVRRRSTVRFRNGAPAQRGFSNIGVSRSSD